VDPVAAKTDDTPSRLIYAAGEVFAEKGFEAASVREICTRAQTSLASIGYHFGDKDGLFTEVVKAAACAPPSTEEVRWPPGTPPEQKLRGLIRAQLTAMLDSSLPRWADQLMVRVMAEPTHPTLEFVVQSVRPKFEQLFSVVAELMPPGTSKSDVLLAGIGIFAQCMHFRIQATLTKLIVGEEEYQTYTLDRLVDHITRFSLAALQHMPSAPAPLPNSRDESFAETTRPMPPPPSRRPRIRGARAQKGQRGA
jgi:TetR/AcrR family transcriptional regulator, regulator of cefoperazone and chloramphenicol sensitivity